MLGFVLSAGPWFYDVKAVEGTYPNWRQVIPGEQDTPNRIVFTDDDVTALRKILPTFPGANTDSAMIALRPGTDGKLAITGRGPDDAQESVLELTGGSTFTGKLQGFGVNAFFLLDAIEAGFRAFTATDELCPLRSDDGHGGTHVLMPMRLSDAPVRQVPAETNEPPAAPPEAAAPMTPTTKDETKPPTAEPEAETKKGHKHMPKETTGTTEPSNALDKVLAAVETAKGKLREAASALTEVADAVKTAVKEGKTQAGDLEKARTTLQKLQAISL